jgi:hypothetical protein
MLHPLHSATGPRHCNPRRNRASAPRHIEEDLRIAGAISKALDCGIVAYELCGFGELVEQPPRKRAEPKKCPMQRGQQQDVEVSAHDVRSFVR